MLTCKQFLRELSDYLDGVVSAEEREALEKHIEECPNCWVVADTTKRTIEIYRCTEPAPVPSAVKDRLMRALEQKIAAHVRH